MTIEIKNQKLPEGITTEMLDKIWVDYKLDCNICLDYIKNGVTFFPNHSAYAHGIHCTCDTCF